MKRLKLGIQRILKAFLAVAFVMSSIALCWSAAYFIIQLLYRKYGAPSSEFVGQLLTLLLGILLMFCISSLFALFTRGRERAFYLPLLHAIRQIAKGDFSVVVEDTERFGRFGELAFGINEMASELSRMETMRQDFISNVSHEIQSPLTSIRGFARALRKKDLSLAERDHYLEIIEAESTRLSGLSDSLLKLSLLDSVGITQEAGPFRLDRQLRERILACEPQWMGKGIEVEAELPAIIVTAAEELLGQVWSNLLHNSIKFTPAGGRIVVTARAAGNDVEITVSDTGSGIPEEDLPRIFERFYKADKARSAGGGGSGLGLSLVKKIVELHRGTVRAESRLGEGTAVTVTLPLAPVAPS